MSDPITRASNIAVGTVTGETTVAIILLDDGARIIAAAHLKPEEAEKFWRSLGETIVEVRGAK